MISHKPSYLAEARGRLPQQFKERPRVDGLLVAWLTETQELEDAMWAVWIDRVLQSNLAFGDLLDKLGKLVGQGREGLSDAGYNTFIRARILANRSDGHRETLIAITRLLTANGLVIVREKDAGVRIDAFGDSDYPDRAAKEFLFGAVVAGVRLWFIWSPAIKTDTFTYSSRYGSADGVITQGYGTVTDASVGGHYAAEFVSPESV